MIHQFAYSLFLGFPMIMYGGIITYMLMLSTASVAILNMKYRIHVVPFKWHMRLAFCTIFFATFHALLGMSLYFNF